LIGALSLSMVIRRYSSWVSFVTGGVLSSVFLGLCAWFTDAWLIGLLRLLSGFTSASVFAGGTVLIAQLAGLHPKRSGTLLGIYYAGGGLGMVLCAGLVPWTLFEGEQAHWLHPWQLGWLAVGATGLLLTLVMWQPAKALPAIQHRQSASDTTAIGRYFFMLAGYFCFGMGYIGYMTFVVALLRAQGRNALEVTVFYGLLGLAVMASSRIWAGLLDRRRDGRPLALLNGLLGVATLLPALTQSLPWVLMSGLLFGAVFLSIVASTTALVRHNLPQAAWPAGISAFTAVFAAGQIVGPTVVGWIADGPGGLERGLVFSALALWVGAALAFRQRSL